jgi:hypothetical protein
MKLFGEIKFFTGFPVDLSIHDLAFLSLRSLRLCGRKSYVLNEN